jgi:hypothetical protein
MKESITKVEALPIKKLKEDALNYTSYTNNNLKKSNLKFRSYLIGSLIRDNSINGFNFNEEENKNILNSKVVDNSPSGVTKSDSYLIFPHLYETTPSGFSNYEMFKLFGNTIKRENSPSGFHAFELYTIFPKLRGSLVNNNSDSSISINDNSNFKSNFFQSETKAGVVGSGFHAFDLLNVFPFSVLANPNLTSNLTLSQIEGKETNNNIYNLINKINRLANISDIRTSNGYGLNNIEQSITSVPSTNPLRLTLNFGPGLKIFLISILLLESLQICAFVSLDLLMFYIFFESILPIVFILIIIFGHGDDRIRSAILFFLFTLAGSLPMLLSILTIYSFVGSTDFNLIALNEISLESQKVL